MELKNLNSKQINIILIAQVFYLRSGTYLSSDLYMDIPMPVLSARLSFLGWKTMLVSGVTCRAKNPSWYLRLERVSPIRFITRIFWVLEPLN